MIFTSKYIGEDVEKTMKPTYYDYESECDEIDETIKYPTIQITCHQKDCTETIKRFWDGSFNLKWYCKKHREKEQ